MTSQQRGAKTRAVNLERARMYLETTKPAHDKVEKILNRLLLRENIRLRFVGPMRLKNGATGARLMAIDFGGLGYTVHIDGYKRPHHYSSKFWEVA